MSNKPVTLSNPKMRCSFRVIRSVEPGAPVLVGTWPPEGNFAGFTTYGDEAGGSSSRVPVTGPPQS
jgi:hypothetical protein